MLTIKDIESLGYRVYYDDWGNYSFSIYNCDDSFNNLNGTYNLKYATLDIENEEMYEFHIYRVHDIRIETVDELKMILKMLDLYEEDTKMA